MDCSASPRILSRDSFSSCITSTRKVARALFFKNWAFTTGSEIHSFPTLLARTLVWPQPEPVAAPTALVAVPERSPNGPPIEPPTPAVGPVETPAPAAASRGPAARPDPLSSGSTLPTNLFTRAGIDDERLQQLVDGRPLTEDDPQLVLKLLYDVRRLGPALADQSLQRGIPWHSLQHDPASHRGQVLELVGQVGRVAAQQLPAELAERFEMQRYYRCQIQVGADRQPALVLAASVPRAWPLDQPLDQRVAGAACF